MALAIGALAVSSLISLAFPLVIIQLLDSVLKHGDQAQLTGLALALVGLFFVQASFTFLQSYTLSYIGEWIVLDMRTALYRHLHALALDFFASWRVGELVSRISSDVTQVRSVLTNNITQLLSNLVTLIGSIAIVFWLNPRLVGFVLVLALAVVGVAAVFGRRFQGLSTTCAGRAGRRPPWPSRRACRDSRGQELRPRAPTRSSATTAPCGAPYARPCGCRCFGRASRR